MTTWSICRGEWRLPLGPLDNLILGRDAGHSFLRFKNDKGETLFELHGKTFDPKKGVQPFPHNFSSYFSTAAYWLNYPTSIGPRLHVTPISPLDGGTETPDGPVLEDVLLEGPPDKILRCLEAALRASDAINGAGLPYYAFRRAGMGQNCHAVTSELVERMTSSCLLPGTMHYAAPGLNNDLEKVLPGLSRITHDDDMSPHDLAASLQKLTQGDANFMRAVKTALNLNEKKKKTLMRRELAGALGELRLAV